MSVQEPDYPRILLVSLNAQPFFDEMYATLIDKLVAKSRVQRAKSPGPVIRSLSPAPAAVLVTDEGIAEGGNRRVWEAVLQYIRQGGTAIVMGHFASFIPPLNIKPLFAEAGLSWEAGSYHRTTLVLNKDAVADPDLAAKLPSEHSQKALFVKNVAPQEAWYRTSANSVVESRVFPPESVHNQNESPVVLARVGSGRLGYIGDVNAEKELEPVILAMCGIL